ncbi:2Fe-2S iron-sulfur cluster-binding protein [Pseudaquidulcibacter saccharophilus]|uniref:2Fe-2S iron-sulfur cluster-binding protein n=1 Tax=Pseudaquidulcibacter saccharophilus TaxID=2831900 RepID=UPI001EFF16C5|nr:2Fe-2S iron-sulfur cluster-binding protein [Pseudaquidulcibacter saccharophilus]
MSEIANTFTLDGQIVQFTPGQTILEAALDAGLYIPHLCFNPELKPHGSCKLCTVIVNGRSGSACTIKAMPGQEVQSSTPELDGRRRLQLQMIFVEGNHFCPGCEKSGNCKLQAVAYDLEMLNPHFPHFFPERPIDASHPDVMIDFNRCILCEQCVQTSRDVDGKNIFALAGRGMKSHLVINSPSGKLGDTDFALTDKAAHVCPVGAILEKRVGYAKPIGERKYDEQTIREQIAADAEGGL